MTVPGRTHTRTWAGIRSSAAVVAAGLLLAACGGAYDTSANAGTDPTGASHKIEITAPADGASVTTPFTLKFTASVPIGPTDTGKDHVHVTIDRETDDYTVVTTPEYTIADLPPGRHVVGVTLQHADHSPDGAAAEITVNVTGPGGASSSAPTDAGGSGGGYDAGY